jgi:phosphoribosylanthranilate isomerase
VLEGFERKIIIAGGLTPENVADTIRKTHPFGVDASSGIETNGSKDKEKMFRFISAVRAEDAQKEGKI